MRFKDKVILISGGNRGIGLAAAKHFHTEGGLLALAARNKQTGDVAAKELNALFLPCDVRQAVDCAYAIQETVRTYGRLDVLVNAAGVIYRNRTLEHTSEEEWDNIFDTNVKGTFLMCKYAMPALREYGGSIVNVASYVGLVGFAGAAAYAASKAAMVNLTRSVALDHAREKVRVNCVCPGSVATDMLYEAWRMFGDEKEARRLWAEKHPLGRIADADEVARVILFLASDEASFITGAALPVDGGITAA